MRSSPNCSHSVIPPLASRFRKKHGVSRRPSLRWLQCLVPSMETRRMVQPPIPGVCTSQGPSRQRKHTAVTVARLSQRKTFELSLRILAEWFLNRSGYCCEIHYTKVLMHRKKILNIHRNTLKEATLMQQHQALLMGSLFSSCLVFTGLGISEGPSHTSTFIWIFVFFFSEFLRLHITISIHIMISPWLGSFPFWRLTSQPMCSAWQPVHSLGAA